ncbi:MAG TPA: thymidine kinase [Acidobacteriaceae bacterium]|nr:thymidine kinase [Acidobacteriaceae bacterium]
MTHSENGHNSREPGHDEAGRDEPELAKAGHPEAGRMEVGRIEAIVGPMFSGKSEELIRRLKRARIARQRVACFKPDIDLRYHRTAIASHSAQTHDAVTVASVAELRRALYRQIPEIEVVGVDEAQFLDDSIVQLAGELVHLGKRVILAGLDTTFTGDPFGPIPALMAIADEVTKLSAVCMVCGAPAVHTQRLGSSRELVVVGAAGVYEARCRGCFRPYLDAPEAAQMELPETGVLL